MVKPSMFSYVVLGFLMFSESPRSGTLAMFK